MINQKEFSFRLQQIMEHFGLSASALADQIGVQRSSISHIISGRNKPSLDFIMKLLKTYSEVDLYWLLNGSGTFPSKTEATSASSDLKAVQNAISSHNSEEIDRIVIFYKDGSFSSYSN